MSERSGNPINVSTRGTLQTSLEAAGGRVLVRTRPWSQSRTCSKSSMHAGLLFLPPSETGQVPELREVTCNMFWKKGWMGSGASG